MVLGIRGRKHALKNVKKLAQTLDGGLHKKGETRDRFHTCPSSEISKMGVRGEKSSCP